MGVQETRLKNEFDQLLRLKRLLDIDKVLPLRYEIKRKGLTFREFDIQITGIEGFTAQPNSQRSYKSNSFMVFFHIPQNYPTGAIPQIMFLEPIPFHPHIFTSGNICWGTGRKPQPALLLLDWLLRVIELINWVEGNWLNSNDRGANPSAMSWWRANRRSIRKYISPIDLERLRFWVEKARD